MEGVGRCAGLRAASGEEVVTETVMVAAVAPAAAQRQCEAPDGRRGSGWERVGAGVEGVGRVRGPSHRVWSAGAVVRARGASR